jgi:hypothetical protein
MANSNRVFVSPGVYTSEKDLTFVAQSVGVTTLGLVGETLKGPAFEPILVSNFDEFKTYFGGTSPAKDGSDNPKYELPYVAKSYLQESNQLFVTRVLGLTGYKPNRTYGIKTLGGMVVGDLVTTGTTTGTTVVTASGITGSTFYAELSGKTASDGDSVPGFILDRYSGNTSGNTGNWFTIGTVPTAATSSLTGTTVSSPIGISATKNWYNTYSNFTNKVYSYLFVYNHGTTSFDVTRYEYSATLANDGKVVCLLRSRGSYISEVLTHRVTGTTSVQITGSDIALDPLSEFTLTVTDVDADVRTFDCSFDTASTKYITKVLGVDVFDKEKTVNPIYVHEVYPNLIKNLFQQGQIRGLNTTEYVNAEDEDFVQQWDMAGSNLVVSEVRGGNVFDLFSFLTISDGNASNNEVKITIQNINVETGEFDVLVRDFYDSDENQVVLEKFSRCSMNPDLPGFVAKKIGTSDGEYEIRSKYVMLVLADNAPADAIPAGFKGCTTKDSIGGLTFKTKYNTAGETIYYNTDGSAEISNGDKVKKVTLGLSSQSHIGYDKDMFKFKGVGANEVTFGFHLSTNASTITDANGNTVYETTAYDFEGQTGVDNPLTGISYCKFTLPVFGGFDGWDIYRNVRTNTDGYIFGKNTYSTNHSTSGGVFSSTVGNSDYYAYLEGINSFSNPEAVDINLFATPGINWLNHSSLVTQAIDMVENDRADSLYIINAPNHTTTAEVVDDLDSVSLDTNYSATYWPWIQVRDTDNATQLYLPPTGEVVKNIALTDNVSYPWFAVAGYSRGLVNSIKAAKKLTLDDRDELYKNRINPIATFSDTGTIIWGNKTLQVRESALDRINVRRLLLRARKLISAVAVRLLFEQNDDQVRQEFLSLVNPILDSIKKERGLYDFRVAVSNDPEDIDANTLRGKIYIKPTRSLEFIDVEFIITPTGASFENI